MKELFCKYINAQCSPQEVRELLAYFSAQDEPALRALITTSLEDIDVEDSTVEDTGDAVTDKIFAAIKTKINSENGKAVPERPVSANRKLRQPR